MVNKKKINKNLIWIIIIAVAILVVIIFLVGRGPIDSKIQQELVKTKHVAIDDFKYVPEVLTVNQGDKVIWTNKDPERHSVKAKANAGINLDSGLLSQGDTYAYTFNVKGTYEYQCMPHQYMTGKIIVK